VYLADFTLETNSTSFPPLFDPGSSAVAVQCEGSLTLILQSSFHIRLVSMAASNRIGWMKSRVGFWGPCAVMCALMFS
jgi:hypothetical protein